jgi:hypothetical protein
MVTKSIEDKDLLRLLEERQDQQTILNFFKQKFPSSDISAFSVALLEWNEALSYHVSLNGTLIPLIEEVYHFYLSDDELNYYEASHMGLQMLSFYSETYQTEKITSFLISYKNVVNQVSKEDYKKYLQDYILFFEAKCIYFSKKSTEAVEILLELFLTINPENSESYELTKLESDVLNLLIEFYIYDENYLGIELVLPKLKGTLELSIKETYCKALLNYNANDLIIASDLYQKTVELSANFDDQKWLLLSMVGFAKCNPDLAENIIEELYSFTKLSDSPHLLDCQLMASLDLLLHIRDKENGLKMTKLTADSNSPYVICRSIEILILFNEIDEAKILLEKYDKLVTTLNFSGLLARKFIYLGYLETNKLQATNYLEQSKTAVQNHNNLIIEKEIENLENKISSM